jgi:large subunit ribosomal protein L21
MYAIIRDSGTQFKVTSGDRLLIDRPVDEVHPETITFTDVLLVAGDGPAKIGAPLVEGATVTAQVLGEKSGPKIDIQKYKRRKGYHRKIGHRQWYLEVKVTSINA